MDSKTRIINELEETQNKIKEVELVISVYNERLKVLKTLERQLLNTKDILELGGL